MLLNSSTPNYISTMMSQLLGHKGDPCGSIASSSVAKNNSGPYSQQLALDCRDRQTTLLCHGVYGEGRE